jgi:hypothetical protein
MGRPRKLTDEERREHHRLSGQAWFEKNKESHRATVRRRTQRDPAWSMWSAAKKRAKKEGLPFDIAREDVVIPKTCPVLGIILEKSEGFKSDRSPSLDRFKPELGYVRGNINVISSRANTIKTNATLNEIRKLFYWMDEQNARG